ncbi:peptidase M15 [Segetibacter sp. 3557_3]|uniref:M15 family metallopeptidase n=1 Tax=Segetibacter sp. 3557_3 TaxID=2547429 RepID=UPI001058B2DE|nr:M15 family metallopeptidase [Segetibacter sp. 3557_3]TDH25607.1 peptidase M15 [Segetibacter sp. 3557_3]
MIDQKNKLLLPIYCLMSGFILSCSPRPNKVLPNEFGLQVAGEGKSYCLTLQTDNNKRMVKVKSYVPDIKTDFKYATSDNFTHKVLYQNPGAYLRLPAAMALAAVQSELKPQGIGLLIYDAYRPYSVTIEMWRVVPDDRYAANPAKGSGHNRGAAVDLTLVDLKTGKELAMPTLFDDFSEKAHHNYLNLPENIIQNRKLLRTTMEKHGFLALDTEWWHYFLPEASRKYDLLDLNFRQMKRVVRKKCRL